MLSDIQSVFDIIFNIGSIILLTIGLFNIFKKCGVKRYYAFIPVFRLYKLGQCADREEEAKLWTISSWLAYIPNFILVYMNTLEYYPTKVYMIFYVILIMFDLMTVVYGIRVYLGLCETFGTKKRWTVLWLFFKPIISVVWGCSSKYQPVSTFMSNASENSQAAAISGNVAEKLDKGLTVDIEARKVKNFFKTKYLLKDIHLSIKPGRMVLLLGGSGAGKTTFLNAVTGYEKADATILLDGVNVYKRFDKMKYEIGFVPQQDLIRYNDTVLRTLSDAAALRLPTNISLRERHHRINEVLEIFGLTPVKYNVVGKQSGGQKKRISIATEFISDPSLFILDEPDSGLDGILARDLMERLHAISREGKIVIVITHTPDRVIDLFDDIIVLGKDANRTGRLVFYGEVEEAKKFFGKDKIEDMVKMINREDEGGEGKSDELIEKYAEVCNGGN